MENTGKEVYKLLVGRLIITTPNVASLPRRIMLLLGINPFLDNRAVGEVAGHIRYFTFDDFHELLKINKFKILKSESDVLNLSSTRSLYSTFILKIHKKLGKSIMVVAEKV